MPVRDPRAVEASDEDARKFADEVHEYVDKNFSASEHLPVALQHFLRPLEVTTCQHAQPVLTVMLGAMAGLCNGANIALWNTDKTPVSAMVSV